MIPAIKLLAKNISKRLLIKIRKPVKSPEKACSVGQASMSFCGLRLEEMCDKTDQFDGCKGLTEKPLKF